MATDQVQVASKGKFRKVIIWPDPVLSRQCEAFAGVDDEVRVLLDDMAFTMDFVGGAGLSAPQVGVSRNAITLRVTKVEHASDCAIHSPPATCNCKPKAGSELVYLVNPEVTFQSEDKQPSTEGCLSFPGLYFPMERPKVVRVSALGYDGAPFEIGGDGLLAAALMHEIDHLNGVLIIDSASRLKYDLVKRKLTRLKGKKNLRYKTPEEAALETARKAQQ